MTVIRTIILKLDVCGHKSQLGFWLSHKIKQKKNVLEASLHTVMRACGLTLSHHLIFPPYIAVYEDVPQHRIPTKCSYTSA